ncbi:MAG: hypothetical protein GTO02_14930 [Candidatus Dadabacteria bacterium]|nr:hypothetical protein [Candidatus Dadabacteria bacterium]
MLKEKVHPGWTEISCHPGYVSTDYKAVYNKEREVEVSTLTDYRILQTINQLDIRLKNYSEFEIK